MWRERGIPARDENPAGVRAGCGEGEKEMWGGGIWNPTGVRVGLEGVQGVLRRRKMGRFSCKGRVVLRQPRRGSILVAPGWERSDLPGVRRPHGQNPVGVPYSSPAAFSGRQMSWKTYFSSCAMPKRVRNVSNSSRKVCVLWCSSCPMMYLTTASVCEAA